MLTLIFVILALVCFMAATANVATKFSLLALGLALLTLAYLFTLLGVHA